MSITSEVDPIDTSNAVEWQSYLSDPTGDVILQSSDNVLFEAHSWTLGKASNAFEGMFHVAIKTANAPIPVDATAEVLNVFLNLASVSLPYISETDFDITAKLLDHSESFDCESMRPKIRERLMPLGNVDPWRLLTIASDRDDLEMGRGQ